MAFSAIWPASSGTRMYLIAVVPGSQTVERFCVLRRSSVFHLLIDALPPDGVISRTSPRATNVGVPLMLAVAGPIENCAPRPIEPLEGVVCRDIETPNACKVQAVM